MGMSVGSLGSRGDPAEGSLSAPHSSVGCLDARGMSSPEAVFSKEGEGCPAWFRTRSDLYKPSGSLPRSHLLDDDGVT